MSGEYIRPPDMNNVHHTIRYNNRFFPYFQGCVGAIDGTHVSACVGGARADKFRGRKGDTTWNVLAACDFDLKFTYMLSGWEGSAHDARVLEHAISEPQNDFPFPLPENSDSVQILKSPKFCSNHVSNSPLIIQYERLKRSYANLNRYKNYKYKFRDN
ncbi:hypothetical protein UlMin_017892 [Ulmus minor]